MTVLRALRFRGTSVNPGTEDAASETPHGASLQWEPLGGSA
jgi:hypothetical protein